MTDARPDKDPWAALSAELDAWSQVGRVADLWWRDDDATSPGPKLDKLIDLTTDAGLLLATIPASVNTELRPVVEHAPHVRVGQHGFAHINHAPRGKGVGAWELGLHRGQVAVLEDLDQGRDILQQLFGGMFIDVVIPPWNRIDSALFQPIAERGFRGISRFGARDQKYVTDHCVFVNSHCDPIKWKSGPRFTGEAKAINQLISHLQSRRTGKVDGDEPTGVLTHHVDLDDAGWAFCSRLVEILNAHPAAVWSSVPALFPDAL